MRSRSGAGTALVCSIGGGLTTLVRSCGGLAYGRGGLECPSAGVIGVGLGLRLVFSKGGRG